MGATERVRARDKVFRDMGTFGRIGQCSWQTSAYRTSLVLAPRLSDCSWGCRGQGRRPAKYLDMISSMNRKGGVTKH